VLGFVREIQSANRQRGLGLVFSICFFRVVRKREREREREREKERERERERERVRERERQRERQRETERETERDKILQSLIEPESLR
jgi:hypothetical protein